MEAVFEIVLQFVLEVAGELLFEAGLQRLARAFGSRTGRFAVGSVAGFAAGLWWGARLSEAGRVEPPRALWVSLVLAGVTGGAALWRGRKGDRPGSESVVAPPWRWPGGRLAGFAVLNAAVAAGIVIGFHPRPPR